MTTSQPQTIETELLECPKCHTNFAVQLVDNINTMSNPECRDLLFSSDFNSFHCPECGEHIIVNCEVLYHDPQSKIIVALAIIPEKADEWISAFQSGLKDISRLLSGYSEALAGADLIGGKNDPYRYRVVVGTADDLREKIRILEDGYDDAVMKHYKQMTYEYLIEHNAIADGVSPEKAVRYVGSDLRDGKKMISMWFWGKDEGESYITTDDAVYNDMMKYIDEIHESVRDALGDRYPYAL